MELPIINSKRLIRQRHHSQSAIVIGGLLSLALLILSLTLMDWYCGLGLLIALWVIVLLIGLKGFRPSKNLGGLSLDDTSIVHHDADHKRIAKWTLDELKEIRLRPDHAYKTSDVISISEGLSGQQDTYLDRGRRTRWCP